MGIEMIRELRSNARIKQATHHPLLAIDCENDSKTGAFICAAVYGDIKARTTYREGGRPRTKYIIKRVECYFTVLDEFNAYLSALKRGSCLLVFFNLAYDKVYINNIIDHSSVLSLGSRVITLRVKGSRIRAIDLCNHVDGTLDDWIKHLNMSDKFGISKAELADYENRVMNDAKATYQLGAFLEDFYYLECGIPLMVTTGAAALRLYTQYYFKDHWVRSDDRVNDFERSAYYGGRVELFRKGKQTAKSYDVNSNYLSIMHNELVPDVATTQYIAWGGHWERYIDDYLGIYHCRVRAPKGMYVGVLPYRVGGKLIFPGGEFEGYWCSPELKAALGAGYVVVKMYDFIYYRQSKHYFRDFAAFIWRKRSEYQRAGNVGMDKVVKKLGNTLYGKFGQRNGGGYFGLVRDIPPALLENSDAMELYEGVGGDMWAQIEGAKIPARHEFPGVAAFITSYARVMLYRALAANIDNLVYCDTDCLKTTEAPKGIIIGSDLGEWAYDGESQEVFYRPKFYGGKKKGVPSRARLVSEGDDHRVYSYDKPLREREAIKRGGVPNVWVSVIKVLTFKDDKRVWIGDRSTPVII